MKVAFVVYPDFTALDLVGPYEMTRRLATRIMLGRRHVRAAARFSAEIARARMRRARDTVSALRVT